MKYRIKDPDKRALVKRLFDVETFELLAGDLRDVSITLQCGGDSASQCIPLEPIRELADGWNPYPRSKPQKNGKYLIAIGEGDLCFVGIGNFAGKSFAAWNPDIIAWRETPKIWKEMEK